MLKHGKCEAQKLKETIGFASTKKGEQIMADKKEIILQKCKNAIDFGEPIMDYNFYYEVIALLKEEQEAHELTKTEWEQWKKDKNREPICMVWYGDATPIWVLKPENVSEPLYLMGKIKLFDKKPRKGQVKWNALCSTR